MKAERKASEELKKCPFCGSEARLICAAGEYWVLCNNKCPGMFTDNKTAAIESWNTRQIEQSLIQTIIKLRDGLEVFSDCQSWSEKEKTCFEKGEILRKLLSDTAKYATENQDDSKAYAEDKCHVCGSTDEFEGLCTNCIKIKESK
jgi:hypothetical protein